MAHMYWVEVSGMSPSLNRSSVPALHSNVLCSLVTFKFHCADLRREPQYNNTWLGKSKFRTVITIGACRPGAYHAMPGLFQILHAHITRTRHEDTWSPANSICVHRHMYSVQRGDKIHFPQCASNAAKPSLAQVPTQLCR